VLDGEALPSDPGALRESVLSAPAVGRISPEGKGAVVAALTGAGRYVGMMGDRVNAVPALKEARLRLVMTLDFRVAWIVLLPTDAGARKRRPGVRIIRAPLGGR
jgi:hypothetical protein